MHVMNYHEIILALSVACDCVNVLFTIQKKIIFMYQTVCSTYDISHIVKRMYATVAEHTLYGGSNSIPNVQYGVHVNTVIIHVPMWSTYLDDAFSSFLFLFLFGEFIFTFFTSTTEKFRKNNTNNGCVYVQCAQ